jgi:hypothetical protein
VPSQDEVWGDDVWIARLTPTAGSSVDGLLRLPLGLDVWERHADALVVAAAESRLAELERRRLADVERILPRAHYEARMRDGPDGGG